MEGVHSRLWLIWLTVALIFLVYAGIFFGYRWYVISQAEESFPQIIRGVTFNLTQNTLESLDYSFDDPTLEDLRSTLDEANQKVASESLRFEQTGIAEVYTLVGNMTCSNGTFIEVYPGSDSKQCDSGDQDVAYAHANLWIDVNGSAALVPLSVNSLLIYVGEYNYLSTQDLEGVESMPLGEGMAHLLDTLYFIVYTGVTWGQTANAVKEVEELNMTDSEKISLYHEYIDGLSLPQLTSLERIDLTEACIRRFSEAEDQLSFDQQMIGMLGSSSYQFLFIGQDKESICAEYNAIVQQRTQEIYDLASSTHNRYLRYFYAFYLNTYVQCATTTPFFDQESTCMSDFVETRAEAFNRVAGIES